MLEDLIKSRSGSAAPAKKEPNLDEIMGSTMGGGDEGNEDPLIQALEDAGWSHIDPAKLSQVKAILGAPGGGSSLPEGAEGGEEDNAMDAGMPMA